MNDYMNRQANCVFCDMSKITGARLVTPTPRIWKFEPLNPVVAGHRLFVAERHTTDAGEAPALTGRVFESAALYADSVGGAYNLITSAGTHATQSVFHLHVHYVPRDANDGLSLPWTDQLRGPVNPCPVCGGELTHGHHYPGATGHPFSNPKEKR